MILEILVLLALIVLNGALSMSEMAIVSARLGRLKPLEAKSKGAAAALRLAQDPGRFLSSVQIGISMVGVLSGALSGATLGLRFSDWLIAMGMDADWAGTVGVAGVVVAVTYVSLVVGELVPKQLALRNAEGIAIRVAPAMEILAIIAAPLVWLLNWSSKALLWLLRQRNPGGNKVTEEEVHSLLAEAHAGGVLETQEREMMAGVMRFADRSARALMTPRHEIQMLYIEATSAEAVAQIRKMARPRMLVQSRESGEVLGIITLADAFNAVSRREPLDLRALLVEVPVVSDQAGALVVMQMLHQSRNHMALVYDEYGNFEGIITTDDLLDAITGAVVSAHGDEPALTQRADGSMLVSGWMPVDEFCDRLELPRALAGEYDTVAGLVLHQLDRMPTLGDVLTVADYQFEVIDLDGFRIDKVLVSKR